MTAAPNYHGDHVSAVAHARHLQRIAPLAVICLAVNGEAEERRLRHLDQSVSLHRHPKVPPGDVWLGWIDGAPAGVCNVMCYRMGN